MFPFSKKEKIPNNENIGEEVKKDQEQEFGPILSEAQILENQNRLKKLIESSSENQSNDITTKKESKQDKDSKIDKIRESLGL